MQSGSGDGWQGAEPESLMFAVETLELLQVQGPNVKSFDPKKLTALSERKGVNLFHFC